MPFVTETATIIKATTSPKSNWFLFKVSFERVQKFALTAMLTWTGIGMETTQGTVAVSLTWFLLLAGVALPIGLLCVSRHSTTGFQEILVSLSLMDECQKKKHQACTIPEAETWLPIIRDKPAHAKILIVTPTDLAGEWRRKSWRIKRRKRKMTKKKRPRRKEEFVCWLLNVPATCECISGTDLLKFTCYHIEIQVADPTFHLTQSQYTDTGPTSLSTDPITPGAWQGSHWSAYF